MAAAGDLSGQRVAIKYATPKGVQALLNEARLLGQLHHPCIIRVLGSCLGGDASAAAVAYEFMPGGTLDRHITEPSSSDAGSVACSTPGGGHRERCSKHLLPWQQRMRVAFQLAAALAHSHRRVRR
jgi:serine/threonine protein kinase